MVLGKPTHNEALLRTDTSPEMRRGSSVRSSGATVFKAKCQVPVAEVCRSVSAPSTIPRQIV